MRTMAESSWRDRAICRSIEAQMRCFADLYKFSAPFRLPTFQKEEMDNTCRAVEILIGPYSMHFDVSHMHRPSLADNFDNPVSYDVFTVLTVLKMRDI